MTVSQISVRAVKLLPRTGKKVQQSRLLGGSWNFVATCNRADDPIFNWDNLSNGELGGLQVGLDAPRHVLTQSHESPSTRVVCTGTDAARSWRKKILFC